MDRRKLLVLSSLFLFVLGLALVFSAAPALAQEEDALTGTALFDVNIRVAPGTNRAVIGRLPYGTKVTAIGRSEGNNWIQIESEETTGWVAAWLLIFSDDTSQLPVTSDVEPPPASDKGPFDLVTPYNMNLRGSPGLSSPVLEVIPFNTAVQAVARSADSSWIKIKSGPREGWIAAWLVVMRGDINELPVSSSVATARPTTERPPQAVATPRAAVSDVTILTPYQVNLRAEPDVKADVVAVVPFNKLVAVTGRNAGNNWMEVSYEGAKGWVAAWIVPISGDPLELPVTSPSTDFVKTYEESITAQAFVDLTIRSKPDSITPVVGVLAAGTEVEVLARTEDSAWVRVKVDEVEGWVIAWPLIASADINNLPVETPTV